MSLINQVLKDLAKPPKPPGSQWSLSRLCESYYKKIKHMITNHYSILCSLALIIIAAFFLTQALLIKKETEKSFMPAITNMTESSSEKFKNVNADLMNESATLTGITFEVQKKITYLRFLLNQEIPYRVSQDRLNRLVIVLEKTELTTSLPPINTMNSAVKAIQMQNENGNLVIILTLHEGAELSRLDLNHVKKLPELQIDLTYELKPVEQFAHEASIESVQEEVENKMDEKPALIKKFRYDLSSKEAHQKALFFAKMGRNNDAIATLTEILTKDPQFDPARKSLASLLFEQGNMEKAEELIQTGLQQRPLYPPYIQLKAQILVIQGKIAEALSLLKKAPPDINDNPDYHAFMAALYQRNGESLFAERLYEQLLKIQPSNSIWWMGLGIARESMHKNNEALEAFTMASNTDHLSLELKVYVENRMNHLK